MHINNNLRSTSRVKAASVVPKVNSTLPKTVVAFLQGLPLVWHWSLPLKWDVEVWCLMVLLNEKIASLKLSKKSVTLRA